MAKKVTAQPQCATDKGPSDPWRSGCAQSSCPSAHYRSRPPVVLGHGAVGSRALEGLFKRGLVGRVEEVSEFIGQEGFANKPGPRIVPSKAGTRRMRKELDIAFPPSGNWLSFGGVPLNDRPPDLLMQLIEYFFVLNGVMKVDSEVDVRPAPLLLQELLTRLDEIKEKGGGLDD